MIPIATPVVFSKRIYGILGGAVSRFSEGKDRTPFSSYEGGMTDFEGALALNQLGRYEQLQRLIGENVKEYRTCFENHFRIVGIPSNSRPAYLYFPVLTPDAWSLKEALRHKGVEVKDKDDMRFFVLYQHPRFSRFKLGRLLNAEKLENEYLLFPVGYQTDEVRTICRATLDAVGSRRSA